ncbi:MAG: hypothetical protein ACRDY0_02705 [Acidimicrobiales bacterium]
MASGVTEADCAGEVVDVDVDAVGGNCETLVEMAQSEDGGRAEHRKPEALHVGGADGKPQASTGGSLWRRIARV